MFWTFCIVKNHKIAANLTTTEAIEEISTDLESLVLEKKVDISTTLFEINLILLNKISYQFLVVTKGEFVEHLSQT